MKSFLMSIAFAGLVAATAFAGPKTVYKNQQQRIAQGVKSGQLTPRETANLEGRERNINREVRADRSANGGHLTAGERAQVGAQHANLSQKIYADKHNAQQDHFGNSEVGRREERQQQRIGNGIQSGRLNANEATHLERRETNVQQEVRTDRSANGGTLTPQERRAVNKQQNRISKRIAIDKSN